MSNEKNDNLEIMRHSLSHIMAAAIEELWPAAKFAIGPAVDNGFYYDIDFGEQKLTEEQRCIKAVELAKDKTSVYWCNTNQESTYLKNMDSEAVEIIGSQSIEQKEEILKAFANCEIKRIITKAKMTGMGLNWQHCNHTVFFPTWSYEQYYQAIRRFWRFGQKNEVTCDMVISDGQTRVLEAIEQKTDKAIQLYENLTKNVNSNFTNKTKEFNKEIIKPKFI